VRQPAAFPLPMEAIELTHPTILNRISLYSVGRVLRTLLIFFMIRNFSLLFRFAIVHCRIDLLQKKYVLSLKICSSLGQTLNYWVDWHLLKLAQPARL